MQQEILGQLESLMNFRENGDLWSIRQDAFYIDWDSILSSDENKQKNSEVTKPETKKMILKHEKATADLRGKSTGSYLQV